MLPSLMHIFLVFTWLCSQKHSQGWQFPVPSLSSLDSQYYRFSRIFSTLTDLFLVSWADSCSSTLFPNMMVLQSWWCLLSTLLSWSHMFSLVKILSIDWWFLIFYLCSTLFSEFTYSTKLFWAPFIYIMIRCYFRHSEQYTYKISHRTCILVGKRANKINN